MDRFQKQSIAIMIDAIEGQLKGLRQLLAIGANQSTNVQLNSHPDRPLVGYTDHDEDKAIEGMFGDIPEDEKEVFMQDIFKHAQHKLGEHADSNDDKQ